MLYFIQVVIVLIKVYNWEILHHSLVCRCGLADIIAQIKRTPKDLAVNNRNSYYVSLLDSTPSI